MTPVEELFQLLWDTPQDKLTWFAIKNRMLDKEKIYISEIYHKAFTNATKGIEEEFEDYQKEMKTPMQEMFDQLKASKKDEYGLAFAIDMLLENEESMLEKEKDAMCEFQELSQRTDYWVHYDGREDCFEKTFNAKEK